MKKLLSATAVLLCAIFIFVGCSKLPLPNTLKSNAEEIAQVYKTKIIKTPDEKMKYANQAMSYFTLSLHGKVSASQLPEIANIDLSGSNTTVYNIAKVAILYKSQSKEFYQQLIKTMLDLSENEGSGYNLTATAFSLIATTVTQSNFSDTEVKYTRDKLIDILINSQKANGGFSNFDYSDIDTTAMVLQALAMHRKIPKVQTSIDKALNFLQNIQNENGGYVSTDNAEYYPVTNSCSTAQVMIALISCDIDPFKDSRFIKNKNNVYDFLMSLKRDDNFIAYSESEKTLANADVGYPTEQVLLALGTALKYNSAGKTLYDFT